MPVSFLKALILTSVLSLGMLTAYSRDGQSAGADTPATVASGDLSKPAFDTTTPVYDSRASPGKSAETVVAEIEGRTITVGNVGDALQAIPAALRAASYETVLEQLIRQQALVVRARQQGVDEELSVRRKAREASDTAIADGYLTKEINKTITEQALLDRYSRDIAGKPGEEEVRARIILAGTEKAAMELIAEIRGGAEFAAVARRGSKDPTAPAGGDLGFATRGQLNPEVGAVAFSLPAGQMAAFPVRSANAWFVVKTEERRVKATPAFAAVRAALVDTLLREGVAEVSGTAVKGLTIRRYNLDGKEKNAER